MQDVDEVTITQIPEPNTDAMVDLLYKSIAAMLQQYTEHFPVSNSDIMGACMYHVIEAGLSGTGTAEQLREDIMAGADRVIAQLQSERTGRKH